MNNMRRGFTMIELVFVIVIIGILAAVALPRFTGIADDAQVSKMQSFVGTLNRSVAPSMWSGFLRNVPAANGSVAFAGPPVLAAKYNTIGTAENVALGSDAQVESIPSAFIGTAAGQLANTATSLALATCAPATVANIIPPIGAANTVTNGILATSATIGSTTYSLGCVDGSISESPSFFLVDNVTGNIVVR